MQSLKALVLATLAAVMCAGCGATDPTSPSSTDFTGAVLIQTFSGTLALGGTIFYSFGVPRAGTVTLTLVDLEEDGAPTSDTISLGLGTPVGTGCASSDAVSASPSATPQVTETPAGGVFCARVADLGTLTAPAHFTVLISIPR